MCMSLKTRELGGIRCQKSLLIIVFHIDHDMMIGSFTVITTMIFDDNADNLAMCS